MFGKQAGNPETRIAEFVETGAAQVLGDGAARGGARALLAELRCGAVELEAVGGARGGRVEVGGAVVIKPGQTVWRVREKSKWLVIHVFEDRAWIERHNGECRFGMIELLADLTATDPTGQLKKHKFKVGDAVLLPGRIVKVDDQDTKLPYRVKYGEEDADMEEQWFTEDYLRADA